MHARSCYITYVQMSVSAVQAIGKVAGKVAGRGSVAAEAIGKEVNRQVQVASESFAQQSAVSQQSFQVSLRQQHIAMYAEAS